MTVLSRLRDALPAERFLERPASGGDAAQDLCRYPTGEALAWVRPVDTSEVATLITLAALAGTPVVAVGKRTAYWWPLSYDGAIAVDTSALTQMSPPSDCAEPIWVGAGVTVRELDEHLRGRGMVLPCHPDAYGDTSVAAMVATGMTSGCGVGSASLATMVAGLKVVLGTGEILTTGASSVLGGAPFMRGGLPDPTGLFFASDGALGVVTEVAVRPVPWSPLARVSWRLPADLEGLRTQAAIAAGLRVPGLYETCRAVQRWDKGPDEAITEVDLIVRAPGGAEELDVRVAQVIRLVDEVAGVTAQSIETERTATGDRVHRWWGEPGGAWRELGPVHMVGVDVNLAHGLSGDIAAASERILEEADDLPWVSLRRALYAAPDHLNLGIHMAFEAQDGAPVEGAHALVDRAIEALSRLEVVPYRWGRLWGSSMKDRLDPAYVRVLEAMKSTCDPQGILHPGASLFGP
jgi:FAD/FMN-containing dehydrogenase